MSSWIEALMRRQRVLLSVALMMSAWGLVSWATMPREEDPRLADRIAVVVTPFPGATPAVVERLVIEPLEEQLFQVGEVKRVRATARAGVAVLVIELAGAVTDTDGAWDDVEAALDLARVDFPAEVHPFRIQRQVMADQEAMVFALTGSEDSLRLLKAAHHLERRLLPLPGVSEVRIAGIQDEQVSLQFDEAIAGRLGLSRRELEQQLSGALTTIPGGTLTVDGLSAMVFTDSSFADLEALRSFQIRLPSGDTVALSEVASVEPEPTDPASQRMRFNGARAVAVSVVPDAAIDVVDLGRRVRAAVAATSFDGLVVSEMSFQPDRVQDRLSSLLGSLLLGMGIVAVVLMLLMGPRLGLVVASVVPLVALTAIAIYAVTGGVLHQIAVAALVIALGMLVDNAIVVAELVQKHIDAGVPRLKAATLAVKELLFPLGVATGTTLAAFIPMAAAQGNVGDFTRAIPVVIMLTLVVSYFYAVGVTPVLSAMALRPGQRVDKWKSYAIKLAHLSSRHPKLILIGAAVAVMVSGLGAGGLDRSFFPKSGRNQLIVEVILPEGAHLSTTDAVSRELEMFLLGDDAVEAVAGFVGRSAPKFYYNLPTSPDAAHFAHIMVRTRSPDDVPRVQQSIRRYAAEHLVRAEVIPRVLEQGPPINAPIEVRLSGDDMQASMDAAYTVLASLRDQDGVVNARHDQGLGSPQVSLRTSDGDIARKGTTRATVAASVLARTRGRPLGVLRYGEDPIPLVVRSGGKSVRSQDLETIDVPTHGGTEPLAQLARFETTWEPAVLHRRNGQRVITVSSHLAEGVAFGSVVDKMQPVLQAIKDAGVVGVELGGNAEGSGEANNALVSAAPLGAVLLVLLLLIEFNSFRRLAIILTTVPLAAAGVIPGLLVADQPFGFMSVLGVSALIGIVVNNAIVLLDRVESARGEGASVQDALRSAIQERTRPIVLTSLTTVTGLLPLALSDSPLWPPMASAMIAGLIASTALTLLVVPSLYRVLFAKEVAAHA